MLYFPRPTPPESELESISRTVVRLIIDQRSVSGPEFLVEYNSSKSNAVGSLNRPPVAAFEPGDTG